MSAGNKLHSEKLALDYLASKGIPFRNVKSIYSELEFCSLGGNDCAGLIKKSCPQANVEFSFYYPGTGGITDSPEITAFRQAQNRLRIQELEKILR